MAVFSGYPQNVTFSSVTIAKGGGSANLLVNPRGKVNQLNEAQGVVAAGQYFCDGWKAGAAGAQVYVDADGIRLISGSIIQLVPNTIEAGRNLRANMDVISGAPVLSINGGTDNEPNGAGEYIQVEISGDNSKFTRIILAESVDIPIYQQPNDELSPCQAFLYVETKDTSDNNTWINVSKLYSGSDSWGEIEFPCIMHKIPACSGVITSGAVAVMAVTKKRFNYKATTGQALLSMIADARP
ncbi:hypothetical protein [Vibrio fluvialis]|uniref:hypothetical protein n=1 Tax=Vibrio fluvialis TaxID=676 RepID=UPI001F285D0F|nr:hypothetical protein [Vibrio fluvialis]MCE7642021.1 hypothetical protein [Vibrio fluvialis]